LVPQPAANPRAFTAIVLVFNGEDWAETQTRKKNHGRGKESQNRGAERDTEKKTGGQRETKQSTKQSKEKTPKEEKNQRATQRGVLVFAIVFVPAENPESTTNSQQAGLSIIFLVSKVAEENEEETQTK
jgi:hypothetical protein